MVLYILTLAAVDSRHGTAGIRVRMSSITSTKYIGLNFVLEYLEGEILFGREVPIVA